MERRPPSDDARKGDASEVGGGEIATRGNLQGPRADAWEGEHGGTRDHHGAMGTQGRAGS